MELQEGSIPNVSALSMKSTTKCLTLARPSYTCDFRSSQEHSQVVSRLAKQLALRSVSVIASGAERISRTEDVHHRQYCRCTRSTDAETVSYTHSLRNDSAISNMVSHDHMKARHGEGAYSLIEEVRTVSKSGSGADFTGNIPKDH